MLDIRDTLACVELACTNPADAGEFRVFNQFTESFSVNELASMVSEAYPGRVDVEHIDPPRVEKEDHYYRAAHTKLLDLGLVPHLLSQGTVSSILTVADRHRSRIDTRAIQPTIDWRQTASPLTTSPIGRGTTPGV